ncbi:MAG: hypothetical protein V2A73_02320 [Pseudomonadota bacterium]
MTLTQLRYTANGHDVRFYERLVVCSYNAQPGHGHGHGHGPRATGDGPGISELG